MRYIEQLLQTDKPKKLWLYLPLTFFILGISVLNWIGMRMSDQVTGEIIQQNIEVYGKNINFLITIFPFAFLLIMLLVWVQSVQKQSIVSLTTAREEIDWKRVRFSFLVWTILSLTFFAYQYFSESSNFVLNFKLGPFLVFFLLALILIPLQTSFEEFFFRAYLMQGIGLATRNRGIALVITSLLFAMMHMSNPEVDKIGYGILIYYGGIGLLLGIITLMDEGVELALGFHAANNVIGALLVTSNWTVFQTNSVFLDVTPEGHIETMDFVIQLAIVFPVLLILFAKVYGWKDWKLKLVGQVVKP